jgi:hypothetical protein
VPSVEPSSTTTTRRSAPALVEQGGQALADLVLLVADRQHDR